MKIAKLLFGTLFISAAFVASAQEETEQERECKRMRFLAGEELKIKNYAAATAYYVKGEKICGGYDKANYDRMIGTISNTIATETDKAKKTAYIDTLVDVYTRSEEKGMYDVATRQFYQDGLNGADDFSLCFAVGYELHKSIHFDMRYYLGVKDVVNSNPSSFQFIENQNKSSVFCFSLGYSFHQW